MKISEDKQKYLEYYFDNITFLGKLQVNAIKEMASSKGQGAEYVSCSFDPNDEDYVQGFVTLLFWKPATEEDTMVLIENHTFYDYLFNVCKQHIQKDPCNEDEVMKYLKQIKDQLKI